MRKEFRKDSSSPSNCLRSHASSRTSTYFLSSNEKKKKKKRKEKKQRHQVLVQSWKDFYRYISIVNLLYNLHWRIYHPVTITLFTILHGFNATRSLQILSIIIQLRTILLRKGWIFNSFFSNREFHPKYIIVL